MNNPVESPYDLEDALAMIYITALSFMCLAGFTILLINELAR